MTAAALDDLPAFTFDDPLLGGGLPVAAEDHLRQAGLAYQDDDAALDHLRQAQILAPDHVAVLIGLYRFFFYKGRLADALEIARVCLAKAARDCNLPANWRRLRASDADFGRIDALRPRFYLFTLKAYAYLQMRLGNLDEGRQAIDKLLELDPTDKLGAGVLRDVLSRTEDGDEDFGPQRTETRP